MKLLRVRVIEQGVSEKIEISDKTMFLEPVRNLDDLVDWEDRLENLGVDYAIAEFECNYKKYTEVDDETVTEASYGKFYSIFVNEPTFLTDEKGEDLDDEDEPDFLLN
jgi:hypothetical protein